MVEDAMAHEQWKSGVKCASRGPAVLRRLAFATLLGFGFDCCGIPAGAAAVISPAAESDAVLKRLDGEPELKAQYRVEQNGGAADVVTIGLAKDYHYKNSALGLWIYDYRARRIFRVSNLKFINDSMYAEVWYRRAELENRANINAMLSKAGVDASNGLTAQDPFWAETELGVTSSKFDRPSLRRDETAGRIAWRVDDDEVVAVKYHTEAVPNDVRAGLRRLWPSIANIHPQIADELAQSGRLPEELWVRQAVRPGRSFETAHWTLTHFEWSKAAKYPLPPGLSAVASQSSGAYPQIFQLLVAAVADQRKPPAAEVYRSRIESAIAHGAGLEALTWTIEMQLAEGSNASCAAPASSDLCSLAARAGPLAKTDPRTAIAFNQRSPDMAERPQLDALPNAYVLRLLWATRPPGKDVKPQDSEADLLHALEASPVANFCKDTGDFYVRSWQPFAAWQVWDLGRLMAGHRHGDLLDQLDVLEAEVARREATLF
jgi:hypothetical protein